MARLYRFTENFRNAIKKYVGDDEYGGVAAALPLTILAQYCGNVVGWLIGLLNKGFYVLGQLPGASWQGALDLARILMQHFSLSKREMVSEPVELIDFSLLLFLCQDKKAKARQERQS